MNDLPSPVVLERFRKLLLNFMLTNNLSPNVGFRLIQSTLLFFFEKRNADRELVEKVFKNMLEAYEKKRKEDKEK